MTGAAGALGSPWTQRGSGTVNRDGAGNAVPSARGVTCYVTYNTPSSGLAQRSKITLSNLTTGDFQDVGPTVRANGPSGSLTAYIAAYSVGGSNVDLHLRVNGSFQGVLVSWDVQPLVNGDTIELEVNDNAADPSFTLRINGVIEGTYTDTVTASPPTGQYWGFNLFSDGTLGTVGVSQWEGSESASPALSINTQPTGAVAGAAFTTQPVIHLLDAGGSLNTGATDTVTATIASGSGSLVGTTTAVASGGVATFTNLGILGTGAHTIQFTASGYSAVTSNSITVAPGAANKLAVLTQPAGAAEGQVFSTQPVIEIQDANGFRVTSSSASVTVAKLSGSGTLGGTLTVAAVNGVATFTNLVVNSGNGAHTLRFTSGSLTQIDSASFTVTAAPVATTLEFTTQPGGAVQGQAFATQPVVRVLDQFGAVMSSASGSVVLTKQSGSGTLAGTTTQALSSGVATFTNVRIDSGTGAHVLTATFGSLTVNSASFTVAASAVATSLQFQTQPGGAVDDVVFTQQPVVRVLDQNSQVLTTASGSVTLTKLSGSGTLVGTTTVALSSGVATFSGLKIQGTGAHTLRATYNALTVDSTSFTVTAAVGPAAKLRMVTQPSGAVQGQPFTTQPQVEICDANDNRVTSSSANVVASVFSGSGTLLGTATVAASSGLATWSGLGIQGASGAHVLRFTSGSLTVVNSATITVSASSTGNPATGYIYFFPVDSGGNPVEGATVTVSSSSPGVATVQSPATEFAAAQYRALVTSVSAGQTTVTSSCNGVNVTQGTVVTVT